ncbi:MAG: hypothetical protein IH593_00060, partial [Bacteroidales bacterium]|nr:hypothetical protein [Bacteroidales bacterium]
MKAGYITAIWIALALSVFTMVTAIAVLFDFSLVTTSPLVYAAVFTTVTVVVGLIIKRFFTLKVLRKFGILGALLVSPVLLFITFLPAAFYYLISAETAGSTYENDFLALITSVAAVIFFSSMMVFTLPALAIISEGIDEKQRKKFRIRKVLTVTALSVLLISAFLLGLKSVAFFHTIGQLLLMPVLSLMLILSFYVLNHEFRGDILRKLSSSTRATPVARNENMEMKSHGLFRSTLLFQSQYIEIISEHPEKILNRSDENFAMNVVHAAARDFDPALIPALNTIAASDRFGESLRHEAAGTVFNIEKYFSDPRQNKDIIMQSGLSEKTVCARSVLLGQRIPPASEVLRLLHDPDPEIRKVGLAAIGRFGLSDMLNEVMQALSVPGTEKEAYHLIKQFSPEIYKQTIGAYLKHSGNEKLNLIIIRLLGSVPSRDAISILEDFSGQGTVSVRLRTMECIKKCGFNPNAGQRKKLTDTVIEMIGNVSTIISLQQTIGKYRFFILEKALEHEREMNLRLIYTILPLIIGPEAVLLLADKSGGASAYSTRLAAEVIEMVAADPLRGPLLALTDHRSDVDKLRELSNFFPVREVPFQSLAEYLLSADQNITGTWTKAVTLRKITEGKLLADRDLLISFLFSQSQILQEEGARAIRFLNPAWFSDVAGRIPEPARQRTTAIIEQSKPDAFMVLDKTRFLNLCFNGIPEERLVSLATAMKYSESYDAESLPGLITWIVPSVSGKSGLYSLSISDITEFIFHYSEYTDIFVD